MKKLIINEIEKASKKDKQSKIITIWVILSFLGVIVVKIVVRPMHLNLSTFGKFLQGTLPNFLASSGYCALAFLYYELLFKTDKENISVTKKLFFASIFSFIGLTLWEIIQHFMGYSIDYEDILMTALGSLTTCIFILAIYKFRANKNIKIN